MATTTKLVELFNAFADASLVDSTATAFVEAAYENLLGLSGDFSNKDARVAYWVEMIEGGVSRADFANTFLTAAAVQGDLLTDAEFAANGVALAAIEALDETDLTLDAVKAAVTVTEEESDNSAATGSAFTLTDNIDVLNGTSGDDTFIGDAATASTADQVVGGEGTDTLRLYGNASEPVHSGIEVVYLKGNTAGFDVSTDADVTTLELDDVATAQTYTIANGQSASVSNMANTEVVDFAGNTVAALDLTVSGLGTAAGAGVTVDLNSTAQTAVTITSSGSSANNIADIANTGAKLTTINVAGSTALDLNAIDAAVTVFDASAMTDGGVTAEFTASTSNVAVTGSAGDDAITGDQAVNYTVTLGAGDDTFTGANLTVDDSVDAGEGDDVLALTVGDAATLSDGSAGSTAILAKLSNFEVLRTTDDLDGSAINIAKFGFNSIQVAAGTTADTTLSGFTSGMTIETRLTDTGANGDLQAEDDAAGAAAVVSVTGATIAGTTDTVNIKLNDNLQANDDAANSGLVVHNFDLAGINIVNIEALDRVNTDAATGDADGYVIDLEDTAGSSANISTITITGTQAVSYAVEAGTVGIRTIDGSASEGDLTINGQDTTFAGTEGIVITGGNGEDTLSGTDEADVISGGADNDTITGESGVDTLTGGAGDDIFVFNTSTGTVDASVVSAASVESITDFTAADDTLRFEAADNVAGASAAAGTAATSNVEVSSVGQVTFADADDTLAEMLTAVAADNTDVANNEVVWWEFNGNTYVYGAGDDTTNAADDYMIVLTGVTGLSSLTESGTTAGDFTFA